MAQQKAGKRGAAQLKAAQRGFRGTRLPAPRGRGSEPDGRMGVLLLHLEQELAKHRWTPPASVEEVKALVTTIGIRACESREQRHAFLTYRGDCLLLERLVSN